MPKNKAEYPFPWQIAEMLQQGKIPLRHGVYVDPYDRATSLTHCGTLHTRVDGSMGRFVTMCEEHTLHAL